ncbi:MAG: patatin family protein [bacterium]|nr:patatin family protein [bacterium]
MKTGLVLEGGAMRGMYTAGVLDIFLENQVKFDGIIGVSAGALFGVNYLSGQKGRVIRYNKRFAGDKRNVGLHSLLRTGDIVNKEFAYYTVPQRIDIFDDETYKNSGVPFYAVVTNMETGEPEYMQVKSVFEDMEILRASGSMPFVTKPVLLNGKPYLDGGVSDSVPYKKFMEMGYDKLVVILTRDLTYKKKPMPASAISLKYRKYPKFKKQLIHRHENYNSSIEELRKLEKEGKVSIVRPSVPIEISRMEKNPEILQKVYDLGIKDGKKFIERK